MNRSIRYYAPHRKCCFDSVCMLAPIVPVSLSCDFSLPLNPLSNLRSKEAGTFWAEWKESIRTVKEGYIVQWESVKHSIRLERSGIIKPVRGGIKKHSFGVGMKKTKCAMLVGGMHNPTAKVP